MRLTQRRIESLACPPGKKDILVFDGEQKGLGVRVMARGGKTFLAQYSFAGVKRRVPLGSCFAISLAKAREAARAILGDVAKGCDPARERKEAAVRAKRKAADEALTLGALVEQWESLHLAEKRARYAAEAVRAVRYAFANRLNTAATDLNRAAVVHVLDSLSKDGKIAAARQTAAYGRACYQWAIKRGALERNPFVNLPLAPVAKRERVLSDVELRAVWQATTGPRTYNAIVRMLILTGQRREEVAGMEWSELSDDFSKWSIPASRAKNGTAHIVPLSAQAQAMLQETPRIEGSAFVFPGQRGSFNGFGSAKASLDEASGVMDWRLHDLRRTVATGLQKLGVRLEVTEAVLNHIAGSRAGIVGVYQRHSWSDEKRAALTAWGERVIAIVEGREAGDNVTPLRPRTA
jgi:integrase